MFLPFTPHDNHVEMYTLIGMNLSQHIRNGRHKERASFKMYLWTKLALFCATAWMFSLAGADYSYTCHPNNTISISGLPTNFSSMNYFAHQSDDLSNCTTTGNQATGTAVVSDCNKNVPIYFTFGTYDGMLENQIQGGQEVEILNITCYEITEIGVNDSISNTIRALVPINETVGVNVTYDVTSTLNVSSAYVGEPVEWSIIFPFNYTLQITSCSAYPGTTDTAANNVPLISFWCSTTANLITDFTENVNNRVASAVIKAFKFFNYDDIYLTCTLKVCPAGSGSCDTSCGKRKKRRSDEKKGAYETKLGTVLHVTDPNSASGQSLRGLLISFLLTMLVFII